jgi:SAM-dependent methyltransferase
VIGGISQESSQDLATFRDPAGSLSIQGDRVLRTVQPRYARESLRFLRSDLARRWTEQGHLVQSHVLSAEETKPLLLEHPRVFFPSYPWEWTPGQWMAAAELTLDLCKQSFHEGWILKDATPLNILFDGPQPVFVDVLSIQRREPTSPLWLAYGQFARTFLLPLAAWKHLGWPLAATLNRRDGYEPRDLYPWLSSGERWTAPLRSLVTLPGLLEKKRGSGGRTPSLRQQPEVASAVLERNLRKAGKTLRALAATQQVSKWSDYTSAADHYSAAEKDEKQAFVAAVLHSLRPQTVLDIGANTGEYSRIAAKEGARVVAWDTDVASTDLNWQRAKNEGLSILPLVADVARPTPAAGWRNAESLSLLERARNRFDCVLMLGVLHHLLLADQIPMAEIARLLTSLTRRSAIVEWVPQTDIRFIDLCRGRDELYQSLNEDLFLQEFGRHFSIAQRKPLSNGRVLFLLEKR